MIVEVVKVFAGAEIEFTIVAEFRGTAFSEESAAKFEELAEGLADELELELELEPVEGAAVDTTTGVELDADELEVAALTCEGRVMAAVAGWLDT